ncbi:hypothetical protein FACS1894192_11180 [Bacilli bacterium]|nr:hypothetical protein FACS1894192_11180 [Bacilli bacterium]
MTNIKTDIIVPLMQKGDATVSFDYDRNVPYLIYWKLNFINSKSSFSSTYIILGVASILGLILDKFFSFSNIFSILFALLIGVSIEKFFTVNFIKSIVKEKEYREFTANEIKEVIKTVRINYTMLKILDVIIKIGTIIMIVIFLTSETTIRGKDIIMSFVVGLILFLLNDCVQFHLSFKAIKELKKQLKGGKFNE